MNRKGAAVSGDLRQLEGAFSVFHGLGCRVLAALKLLEWSRKLRLGQIGLT